uniref:Ubiquitin carboxyl-hydrolase n=1 Tax=Prevotella sp. GTC17254 TaxID=3236794 RepID=A0AB33IZ05_9BACT
MNFFKQPKPRGFHHEMIYVDERSERLAEIERRAKCELGMMQEEGYSPEKIRQAFHQATPRVQRRRQHRLMQGNALGFGLLVVLILLLVLLWVYLI